MKKWLVPLALFVATATCLAGCGGSPSSSSSTSTPSADIDSSVVSSPGASEPAPFSIAESAWTTNGRNGEYVQWVVVAENPNPNAFGRFPKFRVTAKDSDGKILGTAEEVMGHLPPASKMAFGSQLSVTGKPSTVEFDVISIDWLSNDTDTSQYGVFATSNLSIAKDGLDSLVVTGEVTNPFVESVSDVLVVTLLRDEKGTLVGAGREFVSGLPGSGSVPFQASTAWSNAEPTTVETIAQPWFASPDPWEQTATGEAVWELVPIASGGPIPTSTATSTEASGAAAGEPLTLAEACPMVRDFYDPVDAADGDTGDGSILREFADNLDSLVLRLSPSEGKAIAAMASASRAYGDAIGDPGTSLEDFLDADDLFSNQFPTVVRACKAAGSPIKGWS